MRKSLVSLVALGLFAGAPVMAQTATTDEATTNQTQQQQTQQQGTQQQAMGTEQQTGTLGAEQFEQMLSEYEARAEVEARIVRAITPEGNHVLVLVGPRGFEPGGSVAAQDSDVRERFESGRFSDVVILGEPTIFRADLDEDHYIFALSADQMLRFGVQTGGLTGDTTGGTGTQMTRDATELSETDTDTSVEMGQTDTKMQMDPETGTSAQSGGQTGTDTETQMGQTGTDTETQMGQTGTDTETQMGQTGTDTETQMGQTGTDTETQMGQTGTDTETQMGQTGTDTETQMGQTGTETGQAGRALSEPDADRIVSNLEEAGLEDASEFQGRLVKAMGENNAPVFFVITSKDMESEAEIDINEDEVRQKLEDSGLEDVRFIDNARIVRGTLEDDHVFVLAGDLFGQGGQQQ